MLPLTRHQCRIHFESSRVVHGASELRWAPLATRDGPESTKCKYNVTEPETSFCEWLTLNTGKALLVREMLTSVAHD